MTVYTNQAVHAACDLLGMDYEQTYLETIINGTPVSVYRDGMFIHLDLGDYDFKLDLGNYDSNLIMIEEHDAEAVIDALHTAKTDRNKIEQKIEDELTKAKARLELTEEEWKPWPGTTPPEDESCLVTFLDNGHGRTLVGKYHEEFSLWAFPTLDGRVQTFTASDRNITSVNYRPLKL